MFTITMSGKADQFMRGTGLGQGSLSSGDIAGTLALADAYGGRIVRKRGRGYSVTLSIATLDGVQALIEYMEAAISANSDERDLAEVKACRQVIADCLGVIASGQQ